MATSVDSTKTLSGIAHLGAFTWDTKPVAANYAAGTTFLASDVGVAPGMFLVSDGTRWIPLGRQLLARSGEAAAHTGNTNETALATITVPAGLLGISGGLEIYTAWGVTGTTNTKTIRIRLGGIAGTAFLGRALTAATLATEHITRIRNRGAANSQITAAPITGLPYTAATGAAVTGSVDTSAAQDLVISGQLTDGTDTIRINAYEAWVSG